MSEQAANPFLEAPEEPPADPKTAAEKIAGTLRQLSRPPEDAGEMALTLATVAMGLERGLGAELERNQETGELDEFVLALARWLAWHRSDTARMLVVVELPRRTLPAGTKLHLLDEALRAGEDVKSPL